MYADLLQASTCPTPCTSPESPIRIWDTMVVTSHKSGCGMATPTPDSGIPLLLPRQQNSKAMGREMTIKRSQARQGPIQDPEWVVLALTWVLYPPGRVCPCVKDEVPWIMCSAAHTPHQLSWPYWSVIHQPVVTPMLWCPGDVSMPSRFTKGKQEKGPRTWGKLLKHQWSLYGVTHTKGHFNRMSRCSHMEKGLLKWK